jgi:hypothetical protein
MVKARKAAKRMSVAAGRGGTRSRRQIASSQPGNQGTDFCAAARAALKCGEPDAISDAALQRILSAAVKLYAAKVERRGHNLAPFPHGAVTATETVVTACGMIRAADLNMFDVAIWFHRPPGIE